jgi:hypothetical protein
MHPDAHDISDASSRPHPFHWIRNRLSLSGRQGGEDIELRARHTAVVDVPYAKGKRVCHFRPCRVSTPSHITLQRNASARERPMKIIPLKPGNLAASTSLSLNSNAAQQSNGAAQAQSSQAHAAVSTSSSTPPAVTDTTPNANPHVIIKHAGRWTRFWLFICCASSEYTDGHH